MVQGSMNRLVMAFTLFVVPWWHFSAITSAMETFNLEEYKAIFDLEDAKDPLEPKDFFESEAFFDSDNYKDFFDVGEAEALSHIYYHKGWYGSRRLKNLRAKEHLAAYLKRPLEARRSETFFTLPPHLDERIPGVDSLQLMNKMLQSDRRSWPQYIQIIFKTQPSENIRNFWAFISELADYMPTPCLQATFFEVSKEKDKLPEGLFDHTFKLHRIFDFLLARYAKRIKDHVDLLQKKVVRAEKKAVHH